MKEDILLVLYSRPETVFTFRELALIFPGIPRLNLKSRLNYFVSAGKLFKPRRGVFAKANFDYWELANKLYYPSYISLETVLEKEGVIFQKHRTIMVVSYLTRRIVAAGQEIYYRKIKDEVLMHNFGVEKAGCRFVADKERAFLDAVFLYRDYHFDNLAILDWEKITAWQDYYQNQNLITRVSEYYRIVKENV